VFPLVRVLALLVGGAVTVAICTVAAVVLLGCSAALGLYRVLAVTVQTALLTPMTAPDGLGVTPPGIAVRPPGTGRGVPESDPAYKDYLFGPAFLDVGLLVRDAAVLSRGWLVGGVEVPPRYRIGGPAGALVPAAVDLPLESYLDRIRARSRKGTNIAVLRGTVEATGLAIGAAVAAVLVVAAAAATTGVLLLAAGSAAVIALLLRALESSSLWFRGITLECLACHERVRSPVYECGAPLCDARHRRLLPGRWGIFTRHCRCGRRLPTLLITGKRRLRSRCPGCGAVLPTGGFEARTVHIVLAAGPGAGKTVLLVAALNRLAARGMATAKDRIRIADPVRAQEFEAAGAAVAAGDPAGVLATRPSPVIRPWTFHIGRRRAHRLAYVYDPAGEHLWGDGDLDGWEFLGHVTGVALVVDPFSLPGVARLLDDALLDRVRPCRVPPEDVLERMLEALRERGVLPASGQGRIPVAVVVTKGDVLLELPEPGHPYEAGPAAEDAAGWAQRREARDRGVREWLETVTAQRSLVASVEHAFARSAFFVTGVREGSGVGSQVSRRSGRPVVNDDPADVLLWLLRNET
jgi:hypothetical protein